MTETPPRPFQPTGALRPLFFLHIPKTAGSALNDRLSQLYGPQNCIVHAEAQIDAILRGDQPPQRADCVTGHLPWAKWVAAGCAGAYPAMTVLRDPWERLVSHLNWMDRFNHGIDAATLPRLPKGYQAVVAGLAQTDFDSAASLDRFVAATRAGAGRRLFDNLQVRMLAASVSPDTAAAEPTHVDEALQTLAGFALVGRAEALDELTPALAGWAGAPLPDSGPDPVNPAKSHRIAAANALAQQVLAPFWSLDAALLRGAGLLP